MKKIGYIRVSTQEQRPDRQIAGLRDCCDDLHVERLSAASRHRPVFERVIGQLRPGDKLVVWDLDRAFRSTRDALNQIDHIRARGIEIEIVGMNLDMATPIGTVVYTIMSALAQFERDTLAERTREGLAAARLRGVRLGPAAQAQRGADRLGAVASVHEGNDDHRIGGRVRCCSVDPDAVSAAHVGRNGTRARVPIPDMKSGQRRRGFTRCPWPVR